MRVLLRPVLVPELGLVVVKPGRESMPVFHNTRVSWWAVRNQLADALPEAVLRRSLGLPAEKICSVYRESDIVPGEQTATSILKQRTKNLAPLPHAHQQQNPSQEKTVVSITVDPESPESFMKLPKRHRWVKEKYTRWVKTQPCACCGMPADDPHHLICLLYTSSEPTRPY